MNVIFPPKQKGKESFGNYLYEHVFGKLPFGEVHYVGGDNPDPEAECQRYGELLTKYPTDIVFLGIGENAHIAFNDPWVADFNDPKKVKLVPLDEMCRNQQVHDGCFATIDDVPTHAFTLTIPSLTAAKVMICTVPAATKAEAVYNTVKADITADVPATIMRLHNNATMYCDADSGAKLL
jgi:glucosamine-6-phosphate deaminase